MSLQSKEIQLDGKWLIAAPADLVDAVERGRKPQTPAPGSTPPESLLNLVQTAESVGDGRRTRDGFTVSPFIVPGCWEAGVLPKPYEGPVWFVRTFRVDESSLSGGRAGLQFDAVSYVATVWLNGTCLGVHRGMWDSFSFDVTGLLQEENVIAVEVYKPWELFPVRESLAGFIPYVTTTFGGIWQSVSLLLHETISLVDLCARPIGDSNAPGFEITGRVRTHGTTRPVVIRAELDGRAVQTGVDLSGDTAEFRLYIDAHGVVPWRPDSPNIVEIDVHADDGSAHTATVVRTGWRMVGTDGRIITLNDTPVYPRGVLHWLSYPERIAPAPDSDTIRHEIESMQALGYNMIKLCLVVPAEAYFEIADELGMMLWLELPMWMPSVDDEYRIRAKEEYRRILRRVRNHPSVLLYTLGCELSSEADAEFLRELYDLVKEETGAPLVRDNSGSAECYGGVDLEFADFHDYHFYAEAPIFTDLLDYFLPHWKPVKPLVFGEYCDSDTFRSVTQVKKRLGGELYWSLDDPVLNPQGVRWDYNVVTNEDRLAQLDIDISFDEISRRSRAKTLAYRKSIIEQTRAHEAASGYVVTNIQDTPITTSGMLDDFGNLKFSPEAFRRFNSDTVIVLQRDRRRLWRGGDRPQYLDERVFVSGELLRENVIISHTGPKLHDARLSYDLVVDSSGSPLFPPVSGGMDLPVLSAGKPELSGVVEVSLPPVERPFRLLLHLEVTKGDRTVTENEFELWLLPDLAVPWGMTDVVDDRGVFAEELAGTGVKPAELPVRTEHQPGEGQDGKPVLATRWHESLPGLAQDGTSMVLLLDDTTSPLTESLPFFREAIPLVHDHPVLEELPHDGYASTLWSAVTPDRAIKPDELESRFGVAAKPVISRLDSRTSLFTHYMSELCLDAGKNASRVLVTTLALGGTYGRTPQGLSCNVLGRYLLARMIAYLS